MEVSPEVLPTIVLLPESFKTELNTLSLSPSAPYIGSLLPLPTTVAYQAVVVKLLLTHQHRHLNRVTCFPVMMHLVKVSPLIHSLYHLLIHLFPLVQRAAVCPL